MRRRGAADAADAADADERSEPCTSFMRVIVASDVICGQRNHYGHTFDHFDCNVRRLLSHLELPARVPVSEEEATDSA